MKPKTGRTKCFTPKHYQDLITWHLNDIFKGPFDSSYRPKILEPSCGDGALVTGVIDKVFFSYDLTALDIEPQFSGTQPQDFITYDTSNKFDIVIMNPPYIGGIKKKYPAACKQYNISGKNNLFDLFIVKAMEHLHDGGYCVALVPSNVCRRDSNPAINKWNIFRIVESFVKFPGVGIHQYSILFIKKEPYNKDIEPEGYFDYDKHRVIEHCVIRNEDYDLMYQMRYKWLKLKDVCDCEDNDITPYLVPEDKDA